MQDNIVHSQPSMLLIAQEKCESTLQDTGEQSVYTLILIISPDRNGDVNIGRVM